MSRGTAYNTGGSGSSSSRGGGGGGRGGAVGVGASRAAGARVYADKPESSVD